MQQEFFTIATGGPTSQSGLSLKAAHSGRGIAELHYRRFGEHLLATLEPRGLDADDVDAILERMALERDSVIDDPGDSD